MNITIYTISLATTPDVAAAVYDYIQTLGAVQGAIVVCEVKPDIRPGVGSAPTARAPHAPIPQAVPAVTTQQALWAPAGSGASSHTPQPVDSAPHHVWTLHSLATEASAPHAVNAVYGDGTLEYGHRDHTHAHSPPPYSAPAESPASVGVIGSGARAPAHVPARADSVYAASAAVPDAVTPRDQAILAWEAELVYQIQVAAAPARDPAPYANTDVSSRTTDAPMTPTAPAPPPGTDDTDRDTMSARFPGDGNADAKESAVSYATVAVTAPAPAAKHADAPALTEFFTSPAERDTHLLTAADAWEGAYVPAKTSHTVSTPAVKHSRRGGGGGRGIGNIDDDIRTALAGGEWETIVVGTRKLTTYERPVAYMHVSGRPQKRARIQIAWLAESKNKRGYLAEITDINERSNDAVAQGLPLGGAPDAEGGNKPLHGKKAKLAKRQKKVNGRGNHR